ncbi:MAG: T9SS type A sorting domain-containing protein [Chitinophagales bacterium]|nr:T9SS type A sorting domain-containing protein [Chitinophagales bacterium]
MNTSIFSQTIIILLLALSSTAQQTYTYNFNGDFTESSGSGPVLTKICTGQFETDNLPGYNITRKVYHFDTNCGFSFNDAGGFLASGNYTIELYFKMKDLSVWRRVIDFKDRASDYGCYVFNGQMNFYNIVTSGAAPFNADSFSHYVITRNAATKKVILYGNGNQYVTFTDTDNDAIYDASNKKLNFFQDDLVVSDEASEGSIAVLKIHNYTKDSVAIKTSYNNLSGTLTGINSVAASEIFVNIHPNPANTAFVISDVPNQSVITITDLTGKQVYSTIANTTELSINTAGFANGVYMVQVSNDGAVATKKLIVNK